MALTVDNVLDEKVQIDGYGDELTVRQYFARLLVVLWEEEEAFSGKRPFGNSGWKSDILWPISERHAIADEEVDNLIKEALKTKF